MDETLNLTVLVEGYEANRRQQDRELSKLEEAAKNIRGQQQQRKASQDRIASLQRKRASLASERENLRGAYAEASFERDTDELERLTDRREQIDEDLTRLQEEVNAERAILESYEVDSQHAASVAVQRDLLKPMDVRSFIEKLREALEADANATNKRISQISVDESAYSLEEYERIRAGKDMNYAMQLSQEKRLAAKEAEKRKKMRPVSNTSDMADSMGSRRRPEDRLNVTSKGQKVRGYSERRVSNDEEADRTHVLSGDEIRAALAAKKSG